MILPKLNRIGRTILRYFVFYGSMADFWFLAMIITNLRFWGVMATFIWVFPEANLIKLIKIIRVDLGGNWNFVFLLLKNLK